MMGPEFISLDILIQQGAVEMVWEFKLDAQRFCEIDDLREAIADENNQ